LYKGEPTAEGISTYRLVTTLEITGRYHYLNSEGRLNGETSAEFTDTVTSESAFAMSVDAFYSLYLDKTYLQTTIARGENDKLTMRYYRFNVRADYEKQGSGLVVKSKVTDITEAPEGRGEQEIITASTNANRDFTSKKIEGRLVDSEHIAMAIRLQDPAKLSGVTYKMADPKTPASQSFTAAAEVFDSTYEVNGSAPASHNGDKITVKSTDIYTGAGLVFYYSNAFTAKYLIGGGGAPSYTEALNMHVLIEFTEGNVNYVLREYTNYAEKQPA
jgi:hypothetical protein